MERKKNKRSESIFILIKKKKKVNGKTPDSVTKARKAKEKAKKAKPEAKAQKRK